MLIERNYMKFEDFIKRLTDRAKYFGLYSKRSCVACHKSIYSIEDCFAEGEGLIHKECVKLKIQI